MHPLSGLPRIDSIGTQMPARTRDMSTPPPADGLRQRLFNFFYAQEVPYGLALVRIIVPLVLLAQAVPRWFHAREFYSLDGAPTPLWDNYGYPGLLPIPGASVAIVLTTLYLISLVSLSLGWMTRTSALTALVLTAYLGMLDTIGTLTKYTAVASHVLLLLSVSPCGKLWSVDAWLERRVRTWPIGLHGGHPLAPAWPRRLLQILVAVMYFGAALTKLQTPLYFTGDQLQYWLLSDFQHFNPLGEHLSLHPPVLMVMGIATILWEIMFPILCWRGWTKCGALVFGVVFHGMTTLTLGLTLFPGLCLSLYWAFFDPADIQGLARWLRRKSRRRSWALASRVLPRWRFTAPDWATPAASACGLAATCAVLTAVALETEQRMDVYGLARPEGRYVLQPLPQEQVERMLGGMEHVRPEDQLLGFDVGTLRIGGMLANERTEFQHGEQAIVECCLLLPHGDLWVEVNLHDDLNRPVKRSQQIMVRENLRTHFIYDWQESYPAGEYDLVLRLDGDEVARRRITLRSRTTSATAAATAMAR